MLQLFQRELPQHRVEHAYRLQMCAAFPSLRQQQPGGQRVPFTGPGLEAGPCLLAAALVVRGFGLGAVTIPVMAAAYVDLDRSEVPHASIITRTAQQIGGSFDIAVLAVIRSAVAPVPSTRTIARLMTTARHHLSKAETVTVAAIEKGVPMLAEARRIVDDFHVMIRKKDVDQLDPWIAEASPSVISSFTRGITNDKSAIRAAITQPWSDGQVEGQINKLKLVKRQMYGRAIRASISRSGLAYRNPSQPTTFPPTRPCDMCGLSRPAPGAMR